MKITVVDTNNKKHVYLGARLGYEYDKEFLTIFDKEKQTRSIGLFNLNYVKYLSFDPYPISVYRISDVEVDLT